jgi:hypothetical protein
MTWRQFQEETAEFFRSLGCDAQVEAKVIGVRAEHKIDVWVRFTKFGLETKWLIECKDWNSAIPKEKVLALISVVEDVGADRGILISAAGFQPGAVRAAEKTNITLTDLDGLKESAHEDLIASVLHRIETRAVELRYELHDLYTYEQTGPCSLSSKPLPGVDGNAVMRATRALALLEYGFDRVRLKKAPYPVKFDDSGEREVVVDTLEDFVAAASEVIGEAESTLKLQRSRQRK